MSEQCQPILASDRSTVKPGVPFSTTSRLTPRGPVLAGAHGGGHEVGADAAGDEGLGAVDDVGVTVAYGGRGDPRDVGAATRLGDRERTDLLPGQRRPDERVDLVGRPVRGHVRQRDPAGEQRGRETGGPTRLEERLLQRHRVEQRPALPADLLGERDARAARPSRRRGAASAGPRRRPPTPGGAAPPPGVRTRAWSPAGPPAPAVQLTAAPRGCSRAASAATRRAPWPAGRTGCSQRRRRRAARGRAR